MATKYQLHSDWAQVPQSNFEQEGQRTHGVAVTLDGRVVVFHQGEDALLHYDPEGNLIGRYGGNRWIGAHGLTKVESNGEELLWLTDEHSGDVAKVTLDCREVLKLAPPKHPILASGEKKYSPTWVAECPMTGSIFVADGYGSWRIFRYDAEGYFQDVIEGIAGAGTFRCPHGIAFRKTKQGAEFWIADRRNQRILVCDHELRLLRKTESCHSPCSFGFSNDGLVAVPELHSGVKLYSCGDLEYINEVGCNGTVVHRNFEPQPIHPQGWPNLRGTPHLNADVFNSPHAAAFDSMGNLYVVEWIVGGRISKIMRS